MELPTDAPLPVEGDRDADERTTLIDMLEFYRAVLLRKTWALSPEQLNATPLPSTLTLSRLLAHMAFVEDHWFVASFAGDDLPDPWAKADFEHDPDWEMTWGEARPHEQLVEQFTASVERARAVVSANTDLHALGNGSSGQAVSLRWILVHMIEEYARHVGHADLIREALDGQLGD